MQAWKLSWKHLPGRTVHSGVPGALAFLSAQAEHSGRQIYALLIGPGFEPRTPHVTFLSSSQVPGQSPSRVAGSSVISAARLSVKVTATFFGVAVRHSAARSARNPSYSPVAFIPCVDCSLALIELVVVSTAAERRQLPGVRKSPALALTPSFGLVVQREAASRVDADSRL
jgi:hypothetical protein